MSLKSKSYLLLLAIIAITSIFWLFVVLASLFETLIKIIGMVL